MKPVSQKIKFLHIQIIWGNNVYAYRNKVLSIVMIKTTGMCIGQ
jgi:hypothetical protein